MGCFLSFLLSTACIVLIVFLSYYSCQLNLSSLLFQRKLHSLIARVASNIVCFPIITLALLVHGEDDDRLDMVLSAAIIACNLFALLIYTILKVNPNTKFKYDIHGYFLAIIIVQFFCGEYDLGQSLILVLVSAYIDFDLTSPKKILLEIIREIIPSIIFSSILVIGMLVFARYIEILTARYMWALALPWVIAVIALIVYFVYLLVERSKKSCKDHAQHQLEKRHQHILKIMRTFLQNLDEIEGLLLLGSRSSDAYDMYSDVDLMAGCFENVSTHDVTTKLRAFFESTRDCYIVNRKWTTTALGLSVYFDSGASLDISFMPTSEMPIRSPQYKVLFAKTTNFTDAVNAGTQRFAEHSQRYGLDDSIHSRFIGELRYVEIALLREQFIFADIALNNARQFLLSVETVAEGKKQHQFKAYNSLSQAFLNRLEETYPRSRTYEDMHTAKEKLLALYLETVKDSEYLTFDDSLLKLLGCFE